jgi:hypothetical protein
VHTTAVEVDRAKLSAEGEECVSLACHIEKGCTEKKKKSGLNLKEWIDRERAIGKSERRSV